MPNPFKAVKDQPDLHQPESQEGNPFTTGKGAPRGPGGSQQCIECQAADPRLNAEPAARDKSAQHRWNICAPGAEACAAQDRKGYAVLRAGMCVEHHRDQHDGVAKKDREQRLSPGHALLHEAGCQRVRGDHDAHADPQCGDVVGGPRATRQRCRREVRVPQRACGQILGDFHEIVATLAGHEWATL
jgi:hypothetical protein